MRGDPVKEPRIERRTVIVALATVVTAAGCSTAAHRDAGGSAATANPAPAGTTARDAPGTSADLGRSPEPAIARSPGPDIVNGARTRDEVALTFHGAGERSLTEQVLQTCAEHDAWITIFAVGTWLAAAPSLGPQILSAGHELGNHTWSHQQMPLLTSRAALEEIRRGAGALRKATGSTGWWFRPSGTPHSTATIRAAASRSGYQRCVSYDVDPQDYRDPGSALVVSRTLAQVRSGSIVSLHLGHPGTVRALPQILAGLSAKGLAPVTLSRLLRD